MQERSLSLCTDFHAQAPRRIKIHLRLHIISHNLEITVSCSPHALPIHEAQQFRPWAFQRGLS